MTAAAIPSGWTVVGVIWRREMVRFARQPVRIAAAIGTAALLWLVVGSGFAGSFRPEAAGGTNYAAYLLPGMMTLTAMFTAIFSSISVIEDRNEGWLQSVLVSPAPRWSIALGKVAGGATVAWAQAALLLPAGPLLDLQFSAVDAFVALIALAVASAALTAVGVAFAWRCQTSAGFHAVMNLVFMPMWVLSGAFFPAEGATRWLAWLMRINPLTWCTQAIRNPLTSHAWGVPLALSAIFAAAMIAAATWLVATPSKRV